jgi:hypothetical protein
MALHLCGLEFSVPSSLNIPFAFNPKPKAPPRRKTLLYANGNTVKLSLGQAGILFEEKGKKY